MPLEPSVTSASVGPWLCTFRSSSALFSKIFDRPGPKSVSAATNCSGVAVVVAWKWRVAMLVLLLVMDDWVTVSSSSNQGLLGSPDERERREHGEPPRRRLGPGRVHPRRARGPRLRHAADPD